MFESLRNAFKVKDIRKRLIYTFIALVIVRLGTLLPAPAVNRDYTNQIFNSQALGFFNSITGGSFEKLSIFALSITPYISASIIMQLLTIAIPKLEEMQKEGEDGRKKINEFTRYLTVGLAVIESIAMAIGFGNQGALEGGLTFTNLIIIIASFTAGSSFLMWLGEKITENGVGNGISIILTINIISSLPADFINLFNTYIKGQSVVKAVLAIILIILISLALVAYVVVLQDAERRIPVTYAKRIQGRIMVG